MYELKIKSKEDKLNLNKEKEAIITSEDLAQPLSQKQTDTEPDHIVYDMFFARIYGKHAARGCLALRQPLLLAFRYE